MKFIHYCNDCIERIFDLSPSYSNYWMMIVEGYIRGRMVECDLTHVRNSYSKRLLHDMESNGFIVSTEVSMNVVRIKPNGINKIAKGNDEIITVCIDEKHNETYELDENLIED